MAQPDECTGCGRSRARAEEEAVDQCEYAFNRTNGRCLWWAKQAPPARSPVPPADPPATTTATTTATADADEDDRDLEDADADADTGGTPPAVASTPGPVAPVAPVAPVDPSHAGALKSLEDALSAARDEAAAVRRQLASVTAERGAAQAQASEHQAAAIAAQSATTQALQQHGALRGEVDRLQKVVEDLQTSIQRAGPVVQEVGTGAVAASKWLIASRAKVASIGAALGVVLGGGGVGWWHHREAPPAGAATTTTVSQPASAPSMAGAAPAASSRTDTTAAAGASSAVMAAQPPVATATTSAVTPSAALMEARLRAALAAEHLKADVQVSTPLDDVEVDGPTTNAQRARVTTIIRTVFLGAGLPPPQVEQTIQESGTKSPALAPAATASPQPEPRPVAVTAPPRPAAPEPTSASVAAALVAKPVGLEATCDRKLAMSHYNPLYTYKLSSCMHDACCHPGMAQNEECKAFDVRMRLNCPAS